MNAETAHQRDSEMSLPRVALSDVIHVSLALAAILFGNIVIVRAVDIALDAWMR